MQRITFLLHTSFFLCLCFFFLLGQLSNECLGTSPKSSIKVIVEGLEHEEGRLYFALYASDDTFLTANRFKGLNVEANVSMIEFKDIPYGTYGIIVYHDENSNQKLDSGLFGIPKEGTGSSNNANRRFGPPKWEAAQFVLNNTKKTLVIKMSYL